MGSGCGKFLASVTGETRSSMANKSASARKARAPELAPRARVAFIVDAEFEDSEFRVPYDRVQEAGHEAIIVGIKANKPLTGKRGEQITTQYGAGEVSAAEFDALVIPGGYSPDHLRTDPKLVELTREMFRAGKPVAAICHGGWMLAEADIVRGRTVTSWPSIRTDLVNAGARWVDKEVVEHENLITSRKPGDLPKFVEALLEQIKQRMRAAETGPLEERPHAPH
jgi:protease I